ncbi:hypothetical protein [Saccharothrix australiensis]|uniref:hypothetical protein n=1 Tax=Saccharothrix australiensis TaxID=2072 RepID=UPI0011C3BFEB|nr:hypothetical protein [Saccharothrix australiensis]
MLVVDGLDEDRGLDGSPDAHSIAALLPRHGVRVVVAGRPDPGLPDDVPVDHPLRTRARVERLSPSPEAIAVRDAMTRDLKRLLRGTQLQQDLLGFVTAAGGGLSAHDLVELTGASSWQVEDELRSTVGRSFTHRPGDPPVHLLAHEQLHVLAVEMLGSRLRPYHERLHDWASTYRLRGWPPDTPRYLLQGHAATLAATGDRQRLLEHVTDPRRHEVAYTVLGHHQGSLGEIEVAQAVFLDGEDPDLPALARLAVHRNSLQESGAWIPERLPEAQAVVGRRERSEELIMLISDPVVRTRALVGTATALHRAGDAGHAAGLLDKAEALISAFNQYWGEWLHRELADAAAKIQDHDRVRRVVGNLSNAVDKAHVYASVTQVALSVSDREHAEQWYHEAERAFASRPERPTFFGKADAKENALVYATMAAAAASLGHRQRAAELADMATDPDKTYELRTREAVAAVVTKLGQGGFIDTALAFAAARADDEEREDALSHITWALAGDGKLDEAEALARTAEGARYRCARLAAVAIAAGRHGETGRARRLIAETEAALPDVPAGALRRSVVRMTAVATAEAGQHDKAEALAFSRILPEKDFSGVLAVAMALCRRAETDRAERLVDAIEEAARSTSTDIDERVLLRWIDVLTDFGDLDRAEPLAHSLKDSDLRAAAWQRLAEGFACVGDLHRFEDALGRVTRPAWQRRPRMEMIRVLLARGDEADAVRLARAATVTTQRATALDFIAGATRDKELLDEAIALATGSDDLEERAAMLRPMLRTAADMGDRPTAEQLLRTLHTTQDHMNTRARRAGERATSLALPERVRTLTEVAERIGNPSGLEPRDERTPVVRSGAPPLWAGSSPLPFRVQYARALTIGRWIDVVHRVVELAPDTYRAIVEELDRLGRDGT